VRGGFNHFHGDSVAPLPTPELIAVWSGASAKTGPRVARYQAWGPGERARFVADSDAVVASWEADPLAALTAARTLLETALAHAGVAYRTPGLDRIAVLAREHGGAAKPSGAGGGDVAVAVIPDPDARAAFEAACDADGLTPIPVLVVPGVSLD
jgi:phosphomevalonate kinase